MQLYSSDHHYPIQIFANQFKFVEDRYATQIRVDVTSSALAWWLKQWVN
jgi:hypothetical protein